MRPIDDVVVLTEPEKAQDRIVQLQEQASKAGLRIIY